MTPSLSIPFELAREASSGAGTMLHGAIVFSPCARGRVLRIDASRASAARGVVAVALASDVPGERWHGVIERDRPGLVNVGEEVRCDADALALIAAEREEDAWRAAALVEVTCEPLTPVLATHDALANGAPRVNPMHSNLLARSVLTRGNVASALAMSAYVVRDARRSAGLSSPPPVSALAVPSLNRMEIVTHDAFDEARADVARFLALPDFAVRLVAPDNTPAPRDHGLSVHEHAALLARVTRRPVTLTLDGAYAARLRPATNPVDIEYEMGCDADGRLTALRARFVGDSGAYASIAQATLDRAVRAACGPYRVSCVDVEAYAVCTNHPPSGGALGFDEAQVSSALERCIDLLAHKAHLDPLFLRTRNSPEANAA